MRLSRYSAWLGIGCGLAGLAISAFAKAEVRGNFIGNIWLEGSLPADQANKLRQDFGLISSLKIPESNTELKTLLGTHSNSAAELTSWIEARVQVIVGEDFDPDKNTTPLINKYPFSNPGVLPPIEVSTLTPSPGGVTIMSNIGVGAYYGGKASSTLNAMTIDGVGTLPLISPRSGVIQIGPALFSAAYQIDLTDAQSPANLIWQLGTLFHESRHSDGNGKTLGFFHAVCPQGHELQGWNSCDRNLNGPYTVGGKIMQTMDASCTHCTVAQHEALRLAYLDSFGRVIQTEVGGIKPSTNWDATPEGTR